MSDKSDLKAELERKKQRLAQIREEKKRKEEERKKKEVSVGCYLVGPYFHLYSFIWTHLQFPNLTYISKLA